MPHIISVPDQGSFSKFLKEGFIGVRLPRSFYKNIQERPFTDKKRRGLLGTIYDIFADLKRIKVGDEIFLHVKGEQAVYGVFRASSRFMENPVIPHQFKSQNLLVERFEETEIPYEVFPWQVAVSTPPTGAYKNPFDANEIFRIKELTRKIWSVPERWKYEDKEKTVRPLLPEEGKELIALIQEVNRNEQEKIYVEPKDLRSFNEIILPMSPLNGKARDEKIIEAWLMANSIGPEDREAHSNITQILGKFDFVANTIRSYYIKFMDVFGYRIGSDGLKEYRVVEMKTNEATLAHLLQLIGYIRWIAEFFADNDLNRVKGFLIAKNFRWEIQQLWLCDEARIYEFLIEKGFRPHIVARVKIDSALKKSIQFVQYYWKNNVFQLKKYKPSKYQKFTNY